MKTAMTAAFLISGCAALAQSGSVQIHSIEVDGPVIRAVASVAKNQRPIHALNAGGFRWLASGDPIDISKCQSAGDGSDQLALALVIDASGSLRGARLEQCKRSAIDLLASLRIEDEVCVVRVGSKPEVALRATADRQSARKAIGGLAPSGNSAIYDGISLAIDLLGETKASRRAVVLLTDGKENASKATAEDVAQRAKSVDTEVYLLLAEDTKSEGLRQIVAESNGSTYQVTDLSNLRNLYRQIADLLTSNYLLEGRLPATVRQAATIRLEAPKVAPGAYDERSIAISLSSGDGPLRLGSQGLWSWAVASLVTVNAGLVVLLMAKRKGWLRGGAR